MPLKFLCIRSNAHRFLYGRFDFVGQFNHFGLLPGATNAEKINLPTTSCDLGGEVCYSPAGADSDTLAAGPQTSGLSGVPTG